MGSERTGPFLRHTGYTTVYHRSPPVCRKVLCWDHSLGRLIDNPCLYIKLNPNNWSFQYGYGAEVQRTIKSVDIVSYVPRPGLLSFRLGVRTVSVRHVTPRLRMYTSYKTCLTTRCLSMKEVQHSEFWTTHTHTSIYHPLTCNTLTHHPLPYHPFCPTPTI